jgi:hypothetical protein
MFRGYGVRSYRRGQSLGSNGDTHVDAESDAQD